MRTTVFLQDDLDRELRRKARQLGITYKEALNRVVALGLPRLDSELPPYKVRARACGLRPGLDWLHLNRLADEMEDEERLTGR
ncbi:MAG TPA: hypothetical protein VNO81_02395 [Candidatus Nitrosotenuis sp.]|jgi:hypothetical protein|nr:hypothetical protein [Candidatus Nitrosotenuis sp.]